MRERVGTLRIAPAAMLVLFGGLPTKDAYLAYWDLEVRLPEPLPKNFWASKDPVEFPLHGSDRSVTAFGRELVQRAVDHGVANVSVTRYP